MNEKQEVIQWIEHNREYIINVLKDLINIPSVNPWFEGPDEFSKEKEVQQYVSEKLKGLGADIDTWEGDAEKLKKYEGQAGYYPGRDFTDRPNVAAKFSGNGEGNSLLLFGHIDVVQEGSGWTRDAFNASIQNEFLYGRGAVDMKSGVASMICAVEALKESNINLAGDLTVGTVVDEEAGGMGTLDFVDRGYRADGCILTEPTSLQIAPLCRGILWGKLTVKGRSGHIEMPKASWEEGGAVDAIQKSKLVMDQIEHLNKDWAQRKTHPLLPLPCQVYIAKIEGGEIPTSYANQVEITFNAQYLPSERDENLVGGKVKEEITDFIQKVSATDPWLEQNPIEIEWLVDADCAETDGSHEFVKQCANSLEQLNHEPKVEGLGFHTDMGWLVNVGIPTVNFGPGDPRIAHQVDEKVSIEEVIEATKMIAVSAIDWCGIQNN